MIRRTVMDRRHGAAGQGIVAVAGASRLQALRTQGFLHGPAGLVPQGSQPGIYLRFAIHQVTHHCDGCEHRGGVAGVRSPGELDTSRFAGKVHHLRPAGHCRNRHTASHDLGECRKVGLDRKQPGGAAGTETKARDDLIEDKESPVLPGQLPRRLQESQGGRQAAAGPHERLQNEARYAGSVSAKLLFEHSDVVEARDKHLVRHGAGKATALRVLEAVTVLGVIIHADQSPGLGTVPSPSNLQDLFPPGGGPRQHDGIHGCKGAAGGEPDPLGPCSAAESLRHLDLQGVRETRLQPEALCEGRSQRPGDFPGVVPQDVCVMALPEIQDPVTVLISHAGAPRLADAGRKRPQETDGVAAAVYQHAKGVPVD